MRNQGHLEKCCGDLSRFGRNYLETDTYLEKIFPRLDVRFNSLFPGGKGCQVIACELNRRGIASPRRKQKRSSKRQKRMWRMPA